MLTMKKEGPVAKGAGHRKPVKLLLAGVLVACALGGFALRLAWATPGQGNTVTLLAGPVLLDEMDVQSHSDIFDVKIKTKGLSDAYVQHNVVEPGGYSGWHSHPGPVFVLITAGTASVYDAADPTHTPAVYPAGTGFVEQVGEVHNLRNEGATNVELIAFVLVPLTGARRIDEPQPPDYPF